MAPLTALPVELVERIAELITTKDVGNLRLTCRELRGKASQGHFLHHFISHNVDLVRNSIERMTNMLAGDNLSRKLQNLSITSIFHESGNPENIAPFIRGEYWDPHLLSRQPKSACTDEKRAKEDGETERKERLRHAQVCLERAKHQVDVEAGVYPKLLQAAFEQVKQHCQDGILDSLTLKCVVENGEDLRWDLTEWDQQHRGFSNHVAFLFITTMNALIDSGLAVKKLDIFSGTRFCSIPCTELAAFLNTRRTKDIRSLAKSVTSLSISFSRLAGDDLIYPRQMCCNCNIRAKTKPDEEIKCHYHGCEFEDEGDNYCMSERSLQNFLSAFQNLDTLDLHQYEIEHDSDRYNGITFSNIANQLKLQHLRTLALRGVNTDEQSLLTFFGKHCKLESLDLRAVNLNEGQWHAVLAYVKNQLTTLTYLNIENLFEHKRPDSVAQPTGGNIHHFPPIPPPPAPPLLNNPWAPAPPPPAINTAGMTDTFLNTLLAFRVMNITADEYDCGGIFKNNKVTIKGTAVSKADILYGFVSHAANKWKLEKKWNAKMVREYGPPKEILIDLL